MPVLHRNKSRKAKRQKEAIERNSHYEKLSTEEKIHLLDKSLGKNKGAKKQREKLS